MFVKRKVVINPSSGDWVSSTLTDSVYSGGSIAENLSNSKYFAMKFQLRDKASNPFASLLIRLPNHAHHNYNWMEQVAIKARYEGNQRHSFRIQFRNYEPRYYDPADNTSEKYIEAVFDVAAATETLVLDRPLFTVPAWWISQQQVRTEDTRPEFDAISGLDISTSSAARVGGGTIYVESITLIGSYVPTLVLYRALLILWMSSFFVAFLTRIWKMQRTIGEQTRKTEDLVQINNALQLHTKELEEMAHKDTLTGLWNRRGIRDTIFESMRALNTDNQPFSVIMMDIDHFKRINDTSGHAEGDRILQEVAKLIGVRLRNTDYLARWGGEEFLILCGNTQQSQATVLAESLRAGFEQSDLGITCSFGVTQASSKATFADILNWADDALYLAKRTGRNKVCTARR